MISVEMMYFNDFALSADRALLSVMMKTG